MRLSIPPGECERFFHRFLGENAPLRLASLRQDEIELIVTRPVRFSLFLREFQLRNGSLEAKLYPAWVRPLAGYLLKRGGGGRIQLSGGRLSLKLPDALDRFVTWESIDVTPGGIELVGEPALLG